MSFSGLIVEFSRDFLLSSLLVESFLCYVIHNRIHCPPARISLNYTSVCDSAPVDPDRNSQSYTSNVHENTILLRIYYLD